MQADLYFDKAYQKRAEDILALFKSAPDLTDIEHESMLLMIRNLNLRIPDGSMTIINNEDGSQSSIFNVIWSGTDSSARNPDLGLPKGIDSASTGILKEDVLYFRRVPWNEILHAVPPEWLQSLLHRLRLLHDEKRFSDLVANRDHALERLHGFWKLEMDIHYDKVAGILDVLWQIYTDLLKSLSGANAGWISLRDKYDLTATALWRACTNNRSTEQELETLVRLRAYPKR